MAWGSRKMLQGRDFPTILVAGAMTIHAVITGKPQLSIVHLFISAVMPIIKVLIICSIGLIMALPSVNVLGKEARHAMSNLVFSIFLPAIIFVELGAAISPSNFVKWWFIPVNVIITSIVGCAIGNLVAWVCHTPIQYTRITHVMVGIGNMGNMPLVLLSAVCSDANNPFGPSCSTQGIAYIGLGMWMAAIIMWGVVYNYVSPPEMWIAGYEPHPDRKAAKLAAESDLMAMPFEISHMRPPIEPPSPRTPGERVGLMSQRSISRISRTVSNAGVHVVFNTTKFVKGAKWLAKVLHVYDILRPPVLAACLAMIVGLIGPVRHCLFDSDGSLRFLADVLTILGGAMIPGILLVLGGNLANGPGSSKLNPATTIGIVFTRLVIMPAVGLFVVMTADSLGWLPPNDKMFRFICLLQHTMPSSIQIGTAASLRKFGEKEVSAVLFYEHITAVFTMTAYMIIFIFMLFA